MCLSVPVFCIQLKPVLHVVSGDVLKHVRDVDVSDVELAHDGLGSLVQHEEGAFVLSETSMEVLWVQQCTFPQNFYFVAFFVCFAQGSEKLPRVLFELRQALTVTGTCTRHGYKATVSSTSSSSSSTAYRGVYNTSRSGNLVMSSIQEDHVRFGTIEVSADKPR